MHGAIVAAMVMFGVGQTPRDWWRLTDSVEFHWNPSGSIAQNEHERIQKALVLVRVKACDAAVRQLGALERQLGVDSGQAWMKVAWVYFRCMRWTDASRAVRSSGLPSLKWPGWAKVAVGTAFLAHGRPWDAFKVWSNLMLEEQDEERFYRVIAALGALETGSPGKSLSILSAVPVTVARGGGSWSVTWGRILRGLAFLVEGRASRARALLRAAIASMHRFDALSLARPLMVGCFDSGLVVSILLQAAGCNAAAKLEARAAAYRRGHRGGRKEGRTTGSQRRGGVSGSLHCAVFAPALETASRWRIDKQRTGECRVLDEALRRSIRHGP